MAYESGPDGLRQLLFLGSYGTEKIITLAAELYYYVEVTSKDGTRFVIEAYGGEARELEREVLKRKGKEEKLIAA